MTDRIAHESGLFTPHLTDELTYERCVASLSSRLFPDYIWCDFKSEVRHPGGLVHADAALVSCDYSRWYVVEVEMAHHRWDEHIRPQLEKLRQGIFEEKHRSKLLANQPKLDRTQMASLNIYNPDLAVVIDVASPKVRQWCRSRGIVCIEAALFRSRENEIVLALSGDEPIEPTQLPDRKLVGRAHYAPWPVDVPMLLYEFGSEVSDKSDLFEIQCGDISVIAMNFGGKQRGVTLRYPIHEFRTWAGAVTEFDIFKLTEGHFCLEPRGVAR